MEVSIEDSTGDVYINPAMSGMFLVFKQTSGLTTSTKLAYDNVVNQKNTETTDDWFEIARNTIL